MQCKVVTVALPFILVILYFTQFSQNKKSIIDVDNINDENRAIIGVLIDVSGSMESAFTTTTNEEETSRLQAILSTIIEVVNEDYMYFDRNDEIFVQAFGLYTNDFDTCDAVQLLNSVQKNITVDINTYLADIGMSHSHLIELAKENNAPHAKEWIEKYLSKKEATILYLLLKRYPRMIPDLIAKLPDKITAATVEHADKGVYVGLGIGAALIGGPPAWLAAGAIATLTWMGREKAQHLAVENSEAYDMAMDLIEITPKMLAIYDSLQMKLRSRKVEDVLPLLYDLSKNKSSDTFEKTKYITYGGTPMVKAIKEANDVFTSSNTNIKVLFIVSDGESTDGNPSFHIKNLREENQLIIVSCFLTNEPISEPYKLYYEAQPGWSSGSKSLFEMASSMANSKPPLVHLPRHGWILPREGHSRLFIRANSMEVVEQFCKHVVSELTATNDALLNIIGSVSLDQYINQQNADFKPPTQWNGTCYANAIATVYHLAMHRIVGREGGIPSFDSVRQKLINAFGLNGAYVDKVLDQTAREYRLRFKEVNEDEARDAINKQHPVIATFYLYDSEWGHFSEIIRKNPNRILENEDFNGIRKEQDNIGGHAVTLIRCDPWKLTFMNSWSTNWGDGGFFYINNHTALRNMKFYHVFWYEDDLMNREKEVYKKSAAEKGKKVAERFPSLYTLTYECPKCHVHSKIKDYTGNIHEAKCPKCNTVFRPNNEGMIKSLYMNPR